MQRYYRAQGLLCLHYSFSLVFLGDSWLTLSSSLTLEPGLGTIFSYWVVAYNFDILFLPCITFYFVMFSCWLLEDYSFSNEDRKGVNLEGIGMGRNWEEGKEKKLWSEYVLWKNNLFIIKRICAGQDGSKYY